MRFDIRARNADDQIKAREIVSRCIPHNVFYEVFVNAVNVGKEYAICYRNGNLGGGFITFGIDMHNECLTK